MIKVNKDNTSGDIVDSGLYTTYNDGSDQLYSGLFRDSTNGMYVLFEDCKIEPATTIDLATISYANLRLNNLTANGDVVVAGNSFNPYSITPPRYANWHNVLHFTYRKCRAKTPCPIFLLLGPF